MSGRECGGRIIKLQVGIRMLTYMYVYTHAHCILYIYTHSEILTVSIFIDIVNQKGVHVQGTHSSPHGKEISEVGKEGGRVHSDAVAAG